MANATFIRATPARQATHAKHGSMVRNACEPLMVALVLGQVGLSQFAYGQTRDPTVTSDSPEYCDVLMGRITGLARAAAMPPPTDAAVLSEEGERMCVHGQTRGGILRLRRALMIMRRGED
jgi:hypothetical protein